MCQRSIGWNHSFPADRLLEWEAWIKDLRDLDLIKVPRCLIVIKWVWRTCECRDVSVFRCKQCTYQRHIKGTKVHHSSNHKEYHLLILKRYLVWSRKHQMKASTFPKGGVEFTHRQWIQTWQMCLTVSTTRLADFIWFLQTVYRWLEMQQNLISGCKLGLPANQLIMSHVDSVSTTILHGWLALHIETEHVKAVFQLGDPK